MEELLSKMAEERNVGRTGKIGNPKSFLSNGEKKGGRGKDPRMGGN